MKDMKARVRMDGLASDQWRRYGEARRKELVAADEKEGNTKFHLHKKCRIQRYFQLAERVSGTAFNVRCSCASKLIAFVSAFSLGNCSVRGDV